MFVETSNLSSRKSHEYSDCKLDVKIRKCHVPTRN